MCELLAVRSDEPFALAEAWPLAEGLERYGLAGYAWGVAWVRPDGSLDAHRAAGRIFGIGALLLRQVVEPRERAA